MVPGYLRLGLRIDRLLPGFVDAWSGDPRLAAEVAAEARPGCASRPKPSSPRKALPRNDSG